MQNGTGVRCFYIHPESTFKQIWSILIILLLLYVAFIMPFKLAFYEEDDDVDKNSPS